MRLVIALACGCGCAVTAPALPPAANPQAPIGRIAGAPATLRPGVAGYDDLPKPQPPAPHHHHGS